MPLSLAFFYILYDLYAFIHQFTVKFQLVRSYASPFWNLFRYTPQILQASPRASPASKFRAHQLGHWSPCFALYSLVSQLNTIPAQDEGFSFSCKLCPSGLSPWATCRGVHISLQGLGHFMHNHISEQSFFPRAGTQGLLTGPIRGPRFTGKGWGTLS